MDNYALYMKLYKKDPRLPSNPNVFYADEWCGYNHFFGVGGPRNWDFYKTIEEAKQAIAALQIKTIDEYRTKCHLDPKLPRGPHEVYKVKWKELLWSPFYPTLHEASEAAIRLDIRVAGEYKKRRQEDPKLPRHPAKCYQDWAGYPAFLGTLPYPTRQECAAAIQKLGITKWEEYRPNRHKDRRLPSNPCKTYQCEWGELGGYRHYKTYQLASKAARRLGIKTSVEYDQLRVADPRLPSAPRHTYTAEWSDWYAFLDTKPVYGHFYSTLRQAQRAARKLGVRTSTEYRRLRAKDPKLPSCPNKTYADWVSWPSFLLGVPSRHKRSAFYETIEQAGRAAKRLGIRTYIEYLARYKEDPKLPRHPKEFYADDWVSMPYYLGTDRKPNKIRRIA